MAAPHYRSPDPFVPGDNPAASWDDWLETFRLFVSAAELAQKPPASQIAAFLLHGGPDIRKIYKTITILPSTAATAAVPNPPLILDDVLNAFTAYYLPYKNVTSARHVLLLTRQLPHQSFDDFVTDLKIKAIHCDFGALHDSLLCSLIVLGVRDDSVRRDLLKIPVLNLNDVIAHCRADESSKATASAMSFSRLPHSQADAPPFQSLDATYFPGHSASASYRSRTTPSGRGSVTTGRSGSHGARSRGRRPDYKGASSSSRLCDYCAERHPNLPCPAWGAECHKCHRLNHWAKACRQTFAGLCSPSRYLHPEYHDHVNHPMPIAPTSYQPSSPTLAAPSFHHTRGGSVHALQDHFSGFHVGSLKLHAFRSSRTDWIATLRINDLPVTFKLDTGSQVNVLNEQIYRNLHNRPMISPTPAHVWSYTGLSIPMLGVIEATCATPSATKTLSFYVTSQNTIPILSAHASESLGLIQRLYTTHVPESPTVACTDPRNCFGTDGCLPGEHSITLKPDARTVIASPRSVPFALQAPLKAELHRMFELGIIQPVTEATDWVHPMVLVPKPDGSLRICLDPLQLNAALKRERLKLNTSQDIFSHLQGSTVFTVLDATFAFWQIRLTEESSKLCTFATPYGRYRFLCLPYGIASAPEIFHRTMNDIFKAMCKISHF